jgi:hypothetical protein
MSNATCQIPNEFGLAQNMYVVQVPSQSKTFIINLV